MSPLGSFPLGAAPLGGGPLGQPGPVPGAPEGLRLRIGGNPDAAQYLFYRSWRLREQLNGRNSLSCRLVVADGFLPQLEQDFVLTRGADVWFGGFIWSYDVGFLSEGLNEWTTIALDCVDWSAVCDRRIITAIYENMTLGAIVRDIVARTIGQEGISDAGVQEGPLLAKIVFSQITVTQALDDLSRITGFYWDIDYFKVLHVFQRETSLAPFTIVNGVNAAFRKFRKSESLAQYRNSQILDGGKGIALPQQESFLTDGKEQSWLVEKPIHELLAIHLNGVAVPETDIGTRGTEGKKFYWAKGDKTVSQDRNEPPLTQNTTITITSRGLYDLLTKVVDYDGVAARQAAASNSGTGLWEHVQAENSLDGEEVNLLRAQGLLDRYDLSIDAEFELDQVGLAIGQQVHLTIPELGITDQTHLIVELETQSLLLSERRFQARTTTGELKGTFREFWNRTNALNPAALNPDAIAQHVLLFPETMELEDAVSVTRSAWLPAEWGTGIFGESDL